MLGSRSVSVGLLDGSARGCGRRGSRSRLGGDGLGHMGRGRKEGPAVVGKESHHGQKVGGGSLFRQQGWGSVKFGGRE